MGRSRWGAGMPAQIGASALQFTSRGWGVHGPETFAARTTTAPAPAVQQQQHDLKRRYSGTASDREH